MFKELRFGEKKKKERKEVLSHIVLRPKEFRNTILFPSQQAQYFIGLVGGTREVRGNLQAHQRRRATRGPDSLIS